MATHDYVIANGTGAAVRSDLNNALAAIVSNNSGSSEPGTTYAYQWWADTNANVLKLRNSSNDGWVTLRELDGTMLIEDGSAASPGLAFADDTNTGIFSPAADQIGFATNGVERLEISNSAIRFNDGGQDVDFRVESNSNTHMLFVDAGNNRLGVNEDAPDDILHINNAGDSILRIENTGNGNASGIFFVRENSSGTSKGAANIHVVSDTSGTGTELIFGCGSNTSATGGERFRLTSTGKLLINHSASRSVGAQRIVQIEGTSDATAGISILRNTNDSSSPTINLGKSRGTTTGSNTIVQDDDGLGSIYFRAADGTDINSIAASIDVQVDGTPGSNDTPGRIIFGTTGDGAASPTERMRIDNSGRVGIGAESAAQVLQVHKPSTAASYVHVTNTVSGSASGDGMLLGLTGTLAEALVWNQENTDMRFATNNSEAMRIDTSGRLLHGITSVIDSSSSAEFYRASGQNHVRVQSNLLANGEYSMFRAHGIANTNTRQAFIGVYKHSGITNAAPFIFLESESGANVHYWTDNSGDFRTSGSSAHIGTTSGTVVGAQTSDLRLKNVGANVGYGLAEVKQLQPKQYALKTNPDVNKLGFIAQEVESIIPEAVFDTNEELDGHQEGDRTKLGMEYVQLIPVLVNAIKELSAEVDTLKTKVAALEAG